MLFATLDRLVRVVAGRRRGSLSQPVMRRRGERALARSSTSAPDPCARAGSEWRHARERLERGGESHGASWRVLK